VEEEAMTERMVSHSEVLPASTVADLLDWCARNYRDPATVTVSQVYLRWQSPELPAERDRRLAAEAAADARHEAWEVAMWEKLSKKFGS
jgi:hypothetical protein